LSTKFAYLGKAVQNGLDAVIGAREETLRSLSARLKARR
jgi:hypothetical protein